MKTFKFGILALVLGLFTLTSCEKEELEPDNPTTLSSTTTDPIDADLFVDSMMTEWTLNGGAKLDGGMGELEFLVSKTTGELDSLKFRTDWGSDYLVEGGSFEYLGDGKFEFTYEQNRVYGVETFVDTVSMEPHPTNPQKVIVNWKDFNTLASNVYIYTYVD